VNDVGNFTFEIIHSQALTSSLAPLAHSFRTSPQLTGLPMAPWTLLGAALIFHLASQPSHSTSVGEWPVCFSMFSQNLKKIYTRPSAECECATIPARMERYERTDNSWFHHSTRLRPRESAHKISGNMPTDLPDLRKNCRGSGRNCTRFKRGKLSSRDERC
jgi:hypothetical protein